MLNRSSGEGEGGTTCWGQATIQDPSTETSVTSLTRGSVTYSSGLATQSRRSSAWGRSQVTVTLGVFVCKAFPHAAYPSMCPLGKLNSAVLCCLCSFLPLGLMKKHLTTSVWKDCVVICLVLLRAPGRCYPTYRNGCYQILLPELLSEATNAPLRKCIWLRQNKPLYCTNH